MNPNTVNKLLTEPPKTDKIGTAVKVILGVLLLVRIVKTSTDLYFTIEDRNRDRRIEDL
ncbi:hypothetical protein [Aquimarina algiphila]|uniref:hypothetical protein n=1 Tax=Aquimarina algiphila TaxID=2047982 RepID=UPI001430AF04|nr:hypothetical protein [Aquimarina algiphila]